MKQISNDIFSYGLKSSFKYIVFWGGVGLLLSAYWPGAMMWDSFEQYHQTLSHRYVDWHPPIMAWIWSLPFFLYYTPQSMLLFHFSMFLGAIFLLYRSYIKKVE